VNLGSVVVIRESYDLKTLLNHVGLSHVYATTGEFFEADPQIILDRSVVSEIIHFLELFDHSLDI
jgi:hypothetical protein